MKRQKSRKDDFDTDSPLAQFFAPKLPLFTHFEEVHKSSGQNWTQIRNVSQ